MQTIWLLTIALLSSSALSAQITLALSSSAAGSSSAALNLTLTSPAGSEPAGVEWRLTYSPGDVLSINAVVAGTAAAAGKSITCAATAGGHNFFVVGLAI